MKAKSKPLLFILLLSVLVSCKGTKQIQNLNYIANLGFDYKDSKFVVYAQSLNFGNVAKSENAEIGKKIPAWIGIGRGETPMSAIIDLYKSSQIPVFLGHVRTIIITENIIKNRELFNQIRDGMNRYREVRYNILIYGTKIPLLELLSQKSLFNFSPLDSVLNNPDPTFKQDSRINPQYGFRILSHLNEPGRTGRIPSLGLTDHNWSEDQDPRTVLYINGAYFMDSENYKSWQSSENLIGMRWLDKDTNHAPIVVPDASNPYALINVIHPKYKVKGMEEDGELRFIIEVKARAIVQNMMHKATETELDNMTTEAIKNEIRGTYQKGLESETDVLNLFGPLFRNNLKLYNKLKSENKLVLNENSIKEIKIKLTIVSTGKYKNTDVN